MIRVLFVDDSPLMRRMLGGVLRDAGDMEVAVARDGLDALAQLHAFAPDVVTLDVAMPHMDGLACLDRIMVERPCPVVMVSSLTRAGAEATLEAMQLGAVDFIAKPHGAISLEIGAFGPELLARVRAAALARPRRSTRLAERVRLRAGGGPPADPDVPRARRTDRVVLVGTSTGGPPALDTLLSALPAGFPWPVLVAQHMPASFTGPLARRLDRLCALRVVEVTGPVPLVPGTAYVGRGDADLLVGLRPAGPVALSAPSDHAFAWHPSVTRLVASAIQHLGAPRLVGVLMTGMGNDGAAAMTRLRAEGGRTIAESEETAVVWGMPGELVRAGGAEAVLPLDAIARRLLEWAA